MIYTIHAHNLTGRCVGRSQNLDSNGRRCYLLLCGRVLYEVSGDLLKEGLACSEKIVLTDPMRQFLGEAYGFPWDVICDFRRRFDLSPEQAARLVALWILETA